MSGPKSYSPPPYVSKNRLESSLRGLFSLQASIRRLSTEIKGLVVHDQERNISFKCPSYNDECNNALRPFLNTSVPILLSTFKNSIQPEINKKLSSLRKLESNLLAAKSDFLRKQTDYENYVEFENLHAKTNSAMINMIQSCKVYVRKYLESESRQLIETIDSFPLLETLPRFEYGFSQNFEAKKKKLNQQFFDLQDRLKEVRYNLIGNEKPKHDRLLTESAKKHIPEIKGKLQTVMNDDDRSRLEARLEAFLNSRVSIDDYFFNELNEEATKIINSQEQKKTLKSLNNLLNKTPCHVKTEEMRLTIGQEISSLLSNNKIIKKRQIVSLEDNLAAYIQQTTMAIEFDEATDRENQYIRSQIMQGLSNLGYELAGEESELIDFTKGQDYVMKVPGQANFIRIAFNENGSFVYNFMIPEDRTSLTIEATQLKLKEMENSCQLFNEVIGNLIEQGIDLKLNKEQPVEERFLLQIPECYQKVPKKTAKRKAQTKQVKAQQRGVE